MIFQDQRKFFTRMIKLFFGSILAYYNREKHKNIRFRGLLNVNLCD